MSLTTVSGKRIPTQPQIEAEYLSDEDWPTVSRRALAVAYVRDRGVTLGWRLKNIGLERIGLWVVHTCHRGASATS
jgi:hypothetical protein